MVDYLNSILVQRFGPVCLIRLELKIWLALPQFHLKRVGKGRNLAPCFDNRLHCSGRKMDR
jgi:hypothetical protein